MLDVEEEDQDGLGAARGVVNGLGLSLLLWVAILGSIALVHGCHERASVKSGRSQTVEVRVAQALSSTKASVSSVVRLD
jgi:hypothetical protein